MLQATWACAGAEVFLNVSDQLLALLRLLGLLVLEPTGAGCFCKPGPSGNAVLFGCDCIPGRMFSLLLRQSCCRSLMRPAGWGWFSRDVHECRPTIHWMINLSQKWLLIDKPSPPCWPTFTPNWCWMTHQLDYLRRRLDRSFAVPVTIRPISFCLACTSGSLEAPEKKFQKVWKLSKQSAAIGWWWLRCFGYMFIQRCGSQDPPI